MLNSLFGLILARDLEKYVKQSVTLNVGNIESFLLITFLI